MNVYVEVSAVQRRMKKWVETRFGVENLHRKERATRVLEEAIELAQAEGVDYFIAVKTMKAVYDKPVGEPSQEAAGVMVTLLAWAAATEQDLWKLTIDEIERIHNVPINEFRRRHKIKSDAGYAMASHK